MATNPEETRFAPERKSSGAPKLEMAYVLFMDLVAFAIMSMDRQRQVLQQLQELVRGSEEFQRAQADGQLLSLPAGDGMALVFFQNPVSAVQCAVEISRALRRYPSIQLRVGVHAGPVYRIADINTNLNVAGGGINLAQRVMDCGDAGHILVSKTLSDILSQLSEWAPSLHDLGEHEVKHGVKVHLVNLYTNEAGNPAMPRKLDGKASGAGVVAPPAALPAKSYRALYMLTGSVLTLAILAFAGIEVADWLKTSAKIGVQPPPPATISDPAATTPPHASNQPALPVSKAPLLEPSKAEPSNAVLSAAQRAALDELHERMTLLEVRAQKVRDSLQYLQKRSGNLQQDIDEERQGMEFLMEEVGTAFKAEDAVVLKRNLGLAEPQVKKLEDLLGH